MIIAFKVNKKTEDEEKPKHKTETEIEAVKGKWNE